MNEPDKPKSNLTEILLCETSTEEIKYCFANEIINIYDLPLVPEQILDAHNKISHSGSYTNNVYNLKHWCIDLLDTLLIFYKNMYIAIIISLNNNLHVTDLITIVVLKGGKFYCVGVNDYWPSIGFQTYCKLLDNYDFDVSDLRIIKFAKMKIIEYRDSKYKGKMTKAAQK